MKEYYMNLAICQAKKALKKGEVPIGAIIVKNGKIVSKAYNNREKSKNAINHAEIIAIKKACKKLHDWRLEGCEIYVTLQPCIMCFGAILNSRIKKIYYGAKDNKFLMETLSDSRYNSSNHNINIEGGILEKECELILKNFFKKIRKK